MYNEYKIRHKKLKYRIIAYLLCLIIFSLGILAFLVYNIKNIFFIALFLIPFILYESINIVKEIIILRNNLFIDPMTKLSNRNRLQSDLADKDNLALFLINIDSFKEVNDFYGYEAGDFVLIQVAKRLGQIIIDNDYHIYKMQSDEYAVLVNKKLNIKEIEILSNYFNEAVIENPFVFGEYEIHITLTMGIANYNNKESADSVDNLLMNADMALKRAMLNNKFFFIYDKNLNFSKDLKETTYWSKKINEGIKKNNFVPFYQPIINNITGIIEKYECLVRLMDDNKPISPFAFLDISKKTKHYFKITQIMIQKSFDFFKDFNYEFSINISIDDILDDETNTFIMTKLLEYKELKNKVVFELLESEGIENYDNVINFIDQIKPFGAKIAIDDFGTGYSNFYHLTRLNVDFIKIDASLVKNILTDHYSYLVVKNINLFAKDLGLKTIAEFVCSKEIQDIISSLGIDYSQGYYIGEPNPEVKRVN